jgi:tetratricopeptide (TPR) repeat protein
MASGEAGMVNKTHDAAPVLDGTKAAAQEAAESPVRDFRFPLIGWLILAVVVVTVLTHWPAFSSRAVSFDDHQYLFDNPLVKLPSWNSVWRFFSEVLEPSTVAGYYQPLSMTSLMFDVALGGGRDSFVPFHVTSLALHALNTALVVWLLYLLFERAWPAAAVGLMFGVHPLTIEPIPWIGERKTLLATFFALGSLVCYAAYCRSRQRAGPSDGPKPRWGLYAASLVLFVPALLSKPTTVPLPIMLLLLDVWPLRRLSRRALLEKIPFVLLAVGSAIITVVSQARASTISVPSEQTAVRIPLITCHNVIFYLGKMVWPSDLSSHYPFPIPLDWSQPMIRVGVIGTCIVLLALLLSLRWTPAFMVGGLICIVALLPTLQIIGFSDVIASDKYIYFPALGILLILTWALKETASRVGGMARRAVIGLCAVVIAAEVFATRAQWPVWKDTETHYAHMLELAPHAASLHNNVALALAEKKQFKEALEHYRKALEHQPGDERTITNMGVALARGGGRTEAIQLYQASLRELPTSYSIHCNLGALLAESGRAEEATEHYRIARLLKPDSAEALTNYANGLYAMGRYEDAIKVYLEALEHRPDIADIHNNLAACFENVNRPEEALQHYLLAVNLDPDHGDARHNVAYRLALAGDLDAAVSHARAAVRLLPKNIESKFLLAQLLGHIGRTAEAVELLKVILKEDPGFDPAADLMVALLNPATQPAVAKPVSTQP